MYMAYGWPQVIPLEPGLCPSSQQIIYLKVVNRLLLVVSPTHLELWSSAQVPILVLVFCVFSQLAILCGQFLVGFDIWLWFLSFFILFRYWQLRILDFDIRIFGFGWSSAQNKIGKVQAGFGFGAEGRREYAGRVEP